MPYSLPISPDELSVFPYLILYRLQERQFNKAVKQHGLLN